MMYITDNVLVKLDRRR